MNIPEGWKLVPVEPTTEMVAAYSAAAERLTKRHLLSGSYPATWQPVEAGYAAMLSAAPTPPSQQDDEVLEALRQAIHALDEAADSIAGWGSYAGDFFAAKHDLEGGIKRTRDAAAHIRALLTKRGDK